MLVVLEGLDASGKNTQSKRLTERLIHLGHEAALYSFHRYDTELGKAIKRHLLCETAVVEVAHASLVTEDVLTAVPTRRAPEDAMIFQAMATIDKYDAAAEIDDHLKAGHFVVCDRWTQSALAFGWADGLSVEWLHRIQARLPQADLNILLQIAPEEAQRRRPVLRDRYEKDRTKQALVATNYASLWSVSVGNPATSGRWVTVDGNGTIEEVGERIWQEVMKTRGSVRLCG